MQVEKYICGKNNVSDYGRRAVCVYLKIFLYTVYIILELHNYIFYSIAKLK